MTLIKKLSTIFISFLSIFCLTACSKPGNMDGIQVNDNKTTVYTVKSVQDNMYSNELTSNYMIGKHNYTFETDSDGRTVNKFIWEWVLDTDIVRKALTNIQPQKVDEEAMNNCYNYVDQIMHYDSKAWNLNYGKNKKAPSYITILYNKSKDENKTTLQVMIDLTDKNLDLTQLNIQYEELSNYIWPKLYDKETHTYQVSKERIKKAINCLANSKSIEEQLPIVSKGYTVEDSFVSNSNLKSKEIESFVKEAHKSRDKENRK